MIVQLTTIPERRTMCPLLLRLALEKEVAPAMPAVVLMCNLAPNGDARMVGYSAADFRNAVADGVDEVAHFPGNG